MFEKRLGRVLAGLAGTVGSIATIVAFLVKIFGWEVESTTTIVSTALLSIFMVGYIVDRMIGKVNKGLDDKIKVVEDLIKSEQERAKKNDAEQSKAICRLELAIMMRLQPDNKVAIEKKARHYFCDLGGNDWMGHLYSDWATKYDGEISVLMCDNNGKDKK